MRQPLALLSALSFLTLTASGQKGAHGPDIDLETPFVALAAPADGVLELGYDALGTLATLERARRADAPITIRNWALPGVGPVELLVHSVRVMEEGATAVVHHEDGSIERVAPAVELFAGSIPGRASRVFLAFARDQVNGYVELDGELWILSSGGDQQPGQAWIQSMGATSAARTTAAAPNWCQTPPIEANLGQADLDAPESVERLAEGPQIRHAPVFMELDNLYRGRFGSDQAAIDYCVTLVGASSVIYRRDLGATLEIPDGFINLWNSTPPWGVLNDFGDIGAFSAWWRSAANPNRDVRRAAVHVLTNPVFGGVAASINSTCSHGNGYEVSSVNGSFPFPVQHTSPANWDLLVVSHEFGHTFGAQHTFEIGVQCNDGSGPDIGTIMSYCHLNFGVGAIGMRFHRRTQIDVRFVLPNHSCIQYQAIARGDFDGDGDRDALDLAEFDAVEAQGFASLGSDEVFDMDADGTVDAWDRAVLEAVIMGVPEASAAVRNGSGANDECFFHSGTPILGTTWRPTVFTTGPVRPTALIATAEPLVGQNTPFGELLVRTQTVGGQNLLQVAKASEFFTAEYAIALPKDVTLVGLELFTQAVAFNPAGPELCNAIDLRLGFY